MRDRYADKDGVHLEKLMTTETYYVDICIVIIYFIIRSNKHPKYSYVNSKVFMYF